MHQPDLKLSSRAELQLCLARCFLPPSRQADFDALCTELPADLRELNSSLAVLGDGEIDELCDTLSTLPDATTVLATYSRLFLSPPAPALLNLGFYLDGGLQGGSCQAIEDLFRTHGLARDPAFRDTADHLALYLQFVGWMLARAIDHQERAEHDAALAILGELHHSIVRHALPALQRLHAQILKAEDEYHLLPLYGKLCSLAHHALAADAMTVQHLLPQPAASTGLLDKPPPATAAPHLQEDSACTVCSHPFVPAGDLAGMIAVLRAQGLATDHMQVCPDCRAGAMGLSPMELPRMRKAG